MHDWNKQKQRYCSNSLRTHTQHYWNRGGQAGHFPAPPSILQWMFSKALSKKKGERERERERERGKYEAMYKCTCLSSWEHYIVTLAVTQKSCADAPQRLHTSQERWPANDWTAHKLSHTHAHKHTRKNCRHATAARIIMENRAAKVRACLEHFPQFIRLKVHSLVEVLHFGPNHDLHISGGMRRKQWNQPSCSRRGHVLGERGARRDLSPLASMSHFYEPATHAGTGSRIEETDHE